jgi:hypothetical protein
MLQEVGSVAICCSGLRAVKGSYFVDTKLLNVCKRAVPVFLRSREIIVSVEGLFGDPHILICTFESVSCSFIKLAKHGSQFEAGKKNEMKSR